ncbi:GNAT family N-acetyltransferase [Bacillus atrophaeus]|uniref:GNAT family N-acetyltransferase n=1 Tax=Bacillus atrophaeus TaxID=1452 RepID=UPI00227DEEFC|nr:GNAT family N-acetyltransferase [Bacillus atrophaeus]MCY9133259.1 GNAT family N-acetyltransferase [Bacillus atrophaeus]
MLCERGSTCVCDLVEDMQMPQSKLSYHLKILLDAELIHKETKGTWRHEVAGWASLNSYSHRCAYRGVAGLSIYISRSYRGRGVGKALLASIEKEAVDADIHKIVLFTFPFNMLGQGLYSSMGYRQVGIFKEQGKLDGQYVDIMAMEKILTP